MILKIRNIYDWEQRKLNEIVERVVRKNKNLESKLPLTISAQNGLIDQNTFFNKQVASKDVSGYYLLYNGEFAYNKSYSNGYPFGAVKRLDKYEKGVLSTLYIAFCPTTINTDFLVSYYDSSYWQKEVAKHAAEGARNHGLLNISPTDFFQTEIIIPINNQEQEQIGEFFKRLDDTIALHQGKLDKLKNLRKAYLQVLFPAKAEKNPKIRFTNYTETWDQRKLNKLAEFAKGSGYSKSDLKSEGTPAIHYGRLYTNYETSIKEVDTFVEAKENSIISKGNEVIVPASGETSEDISRASVVVKPGIILGGDLNIIKPSTLIKPAFLALTISNGDQQKELTRRAQGKSVVHIRNSDLKEVNLSYPKINEQSKIGSFFEHLDKTISLHQQKLDKLSLLKKAYLKKMFI
ncbi:restriction endonuclease subunit S [Marinilactibacillus psychrotolerans]|uniref:restriction endonuclease subunit S n=1 Tax=Marinilactibacillus psychrotolerans TaxID=191770 RepID=UPI00388868BF